MYSDLFNKFIAVHNAVERERGPFMLFGLVSTSDRSNLWDVVVSAEWGDGDSTRSLISAVATEIQANLVKDDFWKITRIIPYNTSSPLVRFLVDYFQGQDLPVSRSGVHFGDEELNVFLIKCGRTSAGTREIGFGLSSSSSLSSISSNGFKELLPLSLTTNPTLANPGKKD